jgi:hypothetical protein
MTTPPLISRRTMLTTTVAAAASSLATTPSGPTGAASTPTAIDASPTPPPGTPRSTVRMIARWRRHGLDDEGFAEFVATLATCGIPVWSEADGTAMTPVDDPVDFGLLQFQAHNLYSAVVFRNNCPAVDLDAAIAAPVGAPTPSDLVAAYALGAATRGGEFARALLADQDLHAPETLQVPALIGLLLAADIARDKPRVGARAFRPAPAQPASIIRAAGTCTTVATWIDQTVTAIFDAMRITTTDETGVVGAVLAGIWNTLAEIGRRATRAFITAALAQVLPLVRAIAGVLGVASQIIGMLQPWSVAVTGNPSATRFGIDGESVSGTIDARVATAVGHWPDLVRDCATVAGIALPSLTAPGAPITLTLTGAPIDLIDAPTPPSTLEQTGTASIPYTTRTESAATAAGTERQGTVTVTAVVARDDLSQLAASVQSLALAGLPEIVRRFVDPIFGPIAANLVDRIAALAAVRGQGEVVVIYHDPPAASPTPDPATATCIVGDWSLVTILSALNGMVAARGGKVVYYEAEGLSQVSFAADGTFIWTYAGYRVGGGRIIDQVGSVEGVIVIDGTMSGA